MTRQVHRSGHKGMAQALPPFDEAARKVGAKSWLDALDRAERAGYELNREQRRQLKAYRRKLQP